MDKDLETEAAQAASDRFFDAFRDASTSQAKAVVSDIVQQLQGYEQYYELRKRDRKLKDQKIFEETVTAVCCDLVHAHLTHPDIHISISLSNQKLGRKSRYRSPAEGKTLPYIIKLMAAEEMAFLEIEKGLKPLYFEDEAGWHKVQGKRSTIKAEKKLISRIESNELGYDDLGRSESEELIVLKAEKKNHADSGKLLEYEDTQTTNLYRQQMQEINTWMSTPE